MSHVSIIMIAYKHEQFIAQAIEGVMMQETTFPYRLFIGDDRSPDRTEAIAKEYQQRFSDKITVWPRTKNMGVMPNLIDCYDFITPPWFLVLTRKIKVMLGVAPKD